MRHPSLMQGGIEVDERGEISFVNGFGFEGVRRFYKIRNHRSGFVRAWQGHRREQKYFTVITGAALICAVPIDDWNRPSKDAEIYRFALSARKPSVLHVPDGYANGLMSLTADAEVIVFSTLSLLESLDDKVRFDPTYWNPWGAT